MTTARLFTALILALSAPAAIGGTTTWDDGGAPADWHDPDNWDNGVPQADDRAIIPGSFFAHIQNNDAVADTLEIYGKVRIDHGRTLTLSNNDTNTMSGPPDHSFIDGILTIADTSGIGVVRFALANHKFGGGGVVLMLGGRIEINPDITFTNDLPGTPQSDVDGITGRGAIVGIEDAQQDPPKYGHFINSGLVNADGGTLVIGEDTIIADTEDANWSARECSGAVLEFDAGSLSLVGDFEGGRATTLSFYENVKTCGSFRRDGCGIFVAAQTYFAYGAFSATGTCTNSGFLSCTMCPPGGCTNPWYVVVTSAACGTCAGGQ